MSYRRQSKIRSILVIAVVVWIIVVNWCSSIAILVATIIELLTIVGLARVRLHLLVKHLLLLRVEVWLLLLLRVLLVCLGFLSRELGLVR